MSFNIDVNVEHPVQGGKWHLAHGGDLPGAVWFQVSRGRDGQWVCSRLELASDAPITTTVLRGVPISRIVDRLMSMQLDYHDRGGPLDMATGIREWYDGGAVTNMTQAEYAAGGTTADMTPDEVTVAYIGDASRTRAAPVIKRGGAPPDRELLATFAAAYRKAIQTDRLHAIAKTMQILAAQKPSIRISRATANRWRKACREAEPPLLDP